MEQNDIEERLRAKREDFRGLDLCGDQSDEDADPGRVSSFETIKSSSKDTRQFNRLRDSTSLPRSNSHGTLSRAANPRRPLHGLTGSTPDGPPVAIEQAQLSKALSSRHTFTLGQEKPTTGDPFLTSAVPKLKPSISPGKRKKCEEIQTVPEDQQTLKGLHFYFFPNNDTHPPRALRIAKALEYGATWQKELNEHVTHVIADKTMTYGQITGYLKIDNLPAKVALASEHYPAECISFRAVQDATHLRFKVKGQEARDIALKPTSTDPSTSPKLKSSAQSTVQKRQKVGGSSRQRVPMSPAAETHGYGQPAGPLTYRSTPPKSTDELDQAILQAHTLQNLPLDQEEESTSRPTSAEGPTKESGAWDRPRSKQDGFQCMQAHTGPDTSNPNNETIDILQQMATYYDQMSDEWHTRAYRKAIATLRKHPTKVWTKEEAFKLPQIGERLATKIEEIAVTNRLRRLDNARQEPQDLVLRTFMNVYGAGFAQANTWVSAGYTTLDELAEKADLTDNQRIGLKHFADFQTRIPRAEVEQHGAVVRQALYKLDPAFEVIVGGSYRRGAQDSGDIDCIITHSTANVDHIRTVVLESLVPTLSAQNFLVASLAITSRDDGTKWHGASQIGQGKPWRRMDFLLVPPEEMGAALIYFTGNDIFNRSLRLLASTKKMRLNQRGLYRDVMRGKGREKLTEGTLVEGRDEKKIFEALGVPWREPWERQC